MDFIKAILAAFILLLTMVAYGDIFTFYDRPARSWLQFLISCKTKFKKIKQRSS